MTKEIVLLTTMSMYVRRCKASTYKKLSVSGLRSNSCSASNHNTKLVTSTKNVPRNEFSESGRNEERLEEDEISFQGFLAIGTLGAEPPATPKLFAASLMNGSQEKTEDITKDELKLISDKLEKFIVSEAERRFSHSAIRQSNHTARNCPSSGLGDSCENSSFKTEGSRVKANGEAVLCPLQDYLLGSSIEIPKTNDEVKKKKGSIAELFQKKKSAEEQSSTGKYENNRRDPIKKMMTNLHGSPKKTSSAFSKDDESVHKKKKLAKIGQLFRRKIHPFVYIAERDDNQPKNDYKINDMFRNRSYINGSDLTYRDEDNKISGSGEGFLSSGSSYYGMRQYEVVDKSPSAKRGTWIKTDAEYLVLEL